LRSLLGRWIEILTFNRIELSLERTFYFETTIQIRFSVAQNIKSIRYMIAFWCWLHSDSNSSSVLLFPNTLTCTQMRAKFKAIFRLSLSLLYSRHPMSNEAIGFLSYPIVAMYLLGTSLQKSGRQKWIKFGSIAHPCWLIVMSRGFSIGVYCDLISFHKIYHYFLFFSS